MKQSKQGMSKEKIKDLRTKGALEQEKKIIKLLMMIGVIAIILSAIIEILFPLLFKNETLEVLHQSYMVNILLGVACSAAISLVCVWIPFRSKRDNQKARLILLVRNLYYDYIKLYNRIVMNGTEHQEKNTYWDELSLIHIVKCIENDSNKLIDEYNKSEILSKNIEVIVESVNTVFVPIAQIIRYFVARIIPKEYADNLENPLILNVEKCLSQEDNVALYKLLRCSVEKVMSYEDVCDLFSEYINQKFVPFEMIKRDTQELSEREKEVNQYNTIYNIKTSLDIEFNDIELEFNAREVREKLLILEKIKQLEKQIAFQSMDRKEKYNNILEDIYKALSENSWDLVEDILQKIEINDEGEE